MGTHTKPSHCTHTSLQPARALLSLHTQTSLSSSWPAPHSWTQTCAWAWSVTCVWKQLQMKCAIARGAKTRKPLSSQKGKAKPWGLMEKACHMALRKLLWMSKEITPYTFVPYYSSDIHCGFLCMVRGFC